MKLFFSGFSLENEQELFKEYLQDTQYCVSGFSYGAQKAFEYVLNTSKRVDRIQLFSPAFFQDKDKKFKRMQLMFFNKDAQAYCENFLNNCQEGSSNKQLELYFQMGNLEDLESLLNYEWDQEKLEQLKQKNIKLEVYLGGNDKIIDSKNAKDFFVNFGTVYFYKDKGHIL